MILECGKNAKIKPDRQEGKYRKQGVLLPNSDPYLPIAENIFFYGYGCFEKKDNFFNVLLWISILG